MALFLLPRGEVAHTTLNTPTIWTYWPSLVNCQADRRGNFPTLVCVGNLEAILLLYQLLALLNSTLLCITYSYMLPIVNFGETGILFYAY